MAGAEGTPELEIVDVTPWDELEDMMREIPLLGQPDTRPYADATMSIERFKLSELASTTKYVQEDWLARQGILRASLLPQGYDQLDLMEGRLVLEGDGQTVRLAPPIVERFEPDGSAKYILDGSHRAELARRIAEEEGEDPELTVIYVRDGITHPPYALTNPWGEVRVVPERPAVKSEWKNYRDFENRYDLYRDYSDVFDSQPRGLDETQPQ
jgi:hypothetical protein